jgi:hypothetical protein
VHWKQIFNGTPPTTWIRGCDPDMPQSMLNLPAGDDTSEHFICGWQTDFLQCMA